MATPVTSAAPQPNVQQQANESLAQIKAGFDPVRPARYAYKFITGTVTHTLDGIAQWGRKGFWLGGGLGIIAAIALAPMGLGLAPIFAGAFGGLMGAGVIGGTLGLVTGGMREVNRQRRGEKYADELIERSKLQNSAPSRSVDYRRAHIEKSQQRNYVLDQVLIREQEVRNQVNDARGTSASSSWTDRVDASYADRDRQAGIG